MMYTDKNIDDFLENIAPTRHILGEKICNTVRAGNLRPNYTDITEFEILFDLLSNYRDCMTDDQITCFMGKLKEIEQNCGADSLEFTQDDDGCHEDNLITEDLYCIITEDGIPIIREDA